MHRRKFIRDDRGAALLEYSVLVSVILAGAVSAMLFVGPWLTQEWTSFGDAVECTLPDSAEPCVPPGHDK